MNYYNASGQIDLSDRIAIETGICIGESFKKIAKRLRRHPSTIAHEVKENRTFIKGNYPNGKDCRMARQCTVRNLCGCDEEACNTKCRLCRGVDCTKVCDRYVSVACHKFDSPPYVCNNCKDKKLCNKDKYIYSAKFADAAVTRRRSESRQGVRLSDEKKEELDELVTRLVKKGQPLTHIYAEHENEMPVCLRTLYNYIDEGALSIKNIDLRRKTAMVFQNYNLFSHKTLIENMMEGLVIVHKIKSTTISMDFTQWSIDSVGHMRILSMR